MLSRWCACRRRAPALRRQRGSVAGGGPAGGPPSAVRCGTCPVEGKSTVARWILMVRRNVCRCTSALQIFHRLQRCAVLYVQVATQLTREHGAVRDDVPGVDHVAVFDGRPAGSPSAV
eukprot:8461948-Pyramimonas_sp.AAC.1